MFSIMRFMPLKLWTAENPRPAAITQSIQKKVIHDSTQPFKDPHKPPPKPHRWINKY